MLFKADENLPFEVVHLLRQGGHDALSVRDQKMGGATDSHLSAVCQTEGRVLITLDTDFADIRTYPPAQYPGLVVLRLQRQDKTHVLDIIRRMLPLFSKEPLQGRLWIVDERHIRIRNGNH